MTPYTLTVEQLVSRYLDYWDQADIAGLVSMYDPAMQYHDMPLGQVIDYRDLKQFLTDTFAHKTDQHLKLKEAVFLEENSAFIHWTHSFFTRDTGRKVIMNGVELIVFRAGKIISIHEFYDFGENGSEPLQAPEKGTHLEKMTKLGLTDDMMQQMSRELSGYLDRERPYLEPDLTLATVSDHLGYTRNQVSFVINHVLGRTFYDLVNRRRIDHVLAKMSSAEPDLSILELGFDAGFNSVSGFYNAFRKQTDMTPAQYKKRLKPAS
ncbi:MAG: hypothetical protein COB54_01230 [Alphaproteobacteria bacterium]|nr:MAG: hypothetical protein COB54_01230 [Alphaproteobacteria bacterium]